MAINAPTYFFHKLEDFRRLIVKVLEDSKREIRFAAVAALRASLTIVAQRETNPYSGHSGGSHEHNETIAKDYYKVRDYKLFKKLSNIFFYFRVKILFY